MELLRNQMKQSADEHVEILKLQKLEAQPWFHVLVATTIHTIMSKSKSIFIYVNLSFLCLQASVFWGRLFKYI